MESKTKLPAPDPEKLAEAIEMVSVSLVTKEQIFGIKMDKAQILSTVAAVVWHVDPPTPDDADDITSLLRTVMTGDTTKATPGAIRRVALMHYTISHFVEAARAARETQH